MASTSPSVPPIPRRVAAGSGAQLGSGVGLLLGSLLAAGTVFGPPELARVGVGVAVVTAVLAWAAAWSELRAARRQHARERLEAARVSAGVLRTERRRNADVVAALTRRAQEAGSTVERQAGWLAGLRGEIATLHSDAKHLMGEIAHRDRAIVALRDTVRAREAELDALREEVDDAEVHAMPRRVRVEAGGESTDVREVTALWGGTAPARAVDLTADLVIMPNYEVDRRLA